MNDLLMIIPTRSRPHNVRPVVDAWLETGGFLDADLLFAIDVDDPAYEAYLDELQAAATMLRHFEVTLRCNTSPTHQQLVPKLNGVAKLHAQMSPYRALGFTGDDHRPRTSGWAATFLAQLAELGTGIVYPDDGYQHDRIPTSWAMTSDIVRALGAMVPADVEHLFCDNAIRDLGNAAGCLRYLPQVLVEHLHPVAGKADRDEQYERVNSSRQWHADKRAYRRWCADTLPRQAEQVRALTKGEIK